MAKTAYLLEHHNRLANQLWNLIAIYAFCLECGYELRDAASLDYHRYFWRSHPEQKVESLLRMLDVVVPRLEARTASNNRYIRNVSYTLIQALRKIPPLLAAPPNSSPVLFASGAFYLPPSECTDPVHRDLLARAQLCGSLCFKGFLFKNPVGIRTHRAAVCAYVTPQAQIVDRVRAFVQSQRRRFVRIVGLHLRRGDYVTWLGGKLCISEHFARSCLDELLRRREWRSDETLFIVCSDGHVDMDAFNGTSCCTRSGNCCQRSLYTSGVRFPCGLEQYIRCVCILLRRCSSHNTR